MLVGDQRAAHRLHEAAGDRQAEPDAARGAAVVALLERLEHPLARSAGTPGPWSTTSSLALSAPAAAVTSTGPRRRRGAPRCREVGEHALEQPRVGLDERQVLGHVDLDARRRARHGEHRGADDLVERDRLGLHGHRARLEPAGVEQVRDDRRPAGRPTPRSWPAARRARRRTIDVGLAQRADGRLDRGQRRAQVVADGGEQRGALAVDGGQLARPRRARSARRPSYAVCGRGRERLQDPLVLGEQRRAAADQPQVAADRHVEAQRRLLAGRAPARLLDADPVAGSRSRAFSTTDSMLNVSRARSRTPRSVSLSSSSAARER